MEAYQFYPSNDLLASICYGKFKSYRFVRILEPNAGRADLLKYAMRGLSDYGHIDCVELDINNQTILRSKKLRVVASDFLTYFPVYKYSHILMNPPFEVGDKHVLHAWEIVDNAEIVAVLNAETIRNPYTKERKQLVRLIEDHSASEVEYRHSVFECPDTLRKTAVEIAIIHLIKKTELTFDTSFLDNLKKETSDCFDDVRIEGDNALMLPRNAIENRVIDYQCAVEAMKEASLAIAREHYITSRLGKPLAMPDEEWSAMSSMEAIQQSMSERLNKRHDELKDLSWRGIINCTDIAGRLTSSAADKVKSEFENIKRLEFTLENIYAFIEGVVLQQSELQIESLCEAFDIFTKYHSNNRVYFQSWKSNDRHRTHGYSLKKTRVVLPAAKRDAYKGYQGPFFNSCDTDKFANLDKAFAMLDGRHHNDVNGLEKIMKTHIKNLWNGERVKSDYFDMTFYKNSGTFHIFPTRKDLIDRLNIEVGKRRQWLPHDPTECSNEFWKQYNSAEVVNAKLKIDDDVIARSERDAGSARDNANREISIAIREAQLKCGIDYQPECIGTSEIKMIA
ncbi:DUF4942 domain-containing protein [Aeromonas sp. 23P]|uniref:DUF4942 domain-containing protein n=1 Tax=Aeromonas sp. 23P TaxID=3452716 RepID=UPI003F79C5D8|nr:DUF4942 domain-containing protein [Aeromonas veronii]